MSSLHFRLRILSLTHIFSLTEQYWDAIPFTDEYDDEAKWATKEDIHALLEHISDTEVSLGERLDKLGVLANTLENTLASINGLVVKP